MYNAPAGLESTASSRFSDNALTDVTFAWDRIFGSDGLIKFYQIYRHIDLWIYINSGKYACMMARINCSYTRWKILESFDKAWYYIGYMLIFRLEQRKTVIRWRKRYSKTPITARNSFENQNAIPLRRSIGWLVFRTSHVTAGICQLGNSAARALAYIATAPRVPSKPALAIYTEIPWNPNALAHDNVGAIVLIAAAVVPS